MRSGVRVKKLRRTPACRSGHNWLAQRRQIPRPIEPAPTLPSWHWKTVIAPIRQACLISSSKHTGFRPPAEHWTDRRVFEPFDVVCQTGVLNMRDAHASIFG
jgi:hypothetical protein